MKLKFIFFLLLTAIGPLAKATTYDIVVAKDGSGKYKTVQEAINAAPDGGTSPFKILIKKGRYTEHLVIPASKTFVELIGEDVATTSLVYGDGKGGTAVLTIYADDCMLRNLTLVNTQGQLADGPQSLAIRTNSDRLVFYNCCFISGQDTVLVDGKGKRVYFNNCYIDGNTDFIYGPAIAVFDQCVIYCRDRIDFGKGGYLTAASTPSGQTYGLIFRDCLLPCNHGITLYTLGRPWQNDASTETAGRVRAENKTVFLNTKMSNSIAPAGWSAWNAGTRTDVITYAEYNSTDFDGKPVNLSKRVDWSKSLSAEDAKHYYNNSAIFGNWNPYKVCDALLKTTANTSLTIANLNARDVEGETFLQFNSCWPQSGVTYTLYKNGAKADKLTVKTNKIAAYQFKIAEPSVDNTDHYVIKVSRAKEVVTDSLSVTLTSILRKKSGKK